MTDLMIAYKEQILLICSFLYLPMIAFLVSLGMVYLFGRMLGIFKTDVSKNCLAFFSMLGVYAFYFLKIEPRMALMQRIWYGFIYIAVSIILYVVIGFKFYDRMDSFFDRRFGKDHVIRRKKK